MQNSVLSVRNLDVGYDTHSILKNISFSAAAGDMIGIIGANGSGKSTLLKTLRGFLPLHAGSICINDIPIQQLTTRDFSLKTAYLQQHRVDFPSYKVREIVATGRYPHLHWWEREGEQDVAIIRASMAFTGIETLADQEMETLSGGQQQRVLLAKILAQQSELLLLDEPATGLDVFYQEEIFRLCQTLCRSGKTILLVAHELPLAARFCSRLILLGQGGVVALGTVDEVLTDENLTKAYGVPIHVSINPDTGHREVYGMSTGHSAEAALLALLVGSKGGDTHES